MLLVFADMNWSRAMMSYKLGFKSMSSEIFFDKLFVWYQEAGLARSRVLFFKMDRNLSAAAAGLT